MAIFNKPGKYNRRLLPPDSGMKFLSMELARNGTTKASVDCFIVPCKVFVQNGKRNVFLRFTIFMDLFNHLTELETSYCYVWTTPMVSCLHHHVWYDCKIFHYYNWILPKIDEFITRLFSF